MKRSEESFILEREMPLVTLSRAPMIAHIVHRACPIEQARTLWLDAPVTILASTVIPVLHIYIVGANRAIVPLEVAPEQRHAEEVRPEPKRESAMLGQVMLPEIIILGFAVDC